LGLFNCTAHTMSPNQVTPESDAKSQTTSARPLPNSNVQFFDARSAVDALAPGAFGALPYTARVLAENLVRKCPAELRDAALLQLINRERSLDFPWFPARVILQDILGATALVDMAGLRDAIAEQGGDPTQINPVVPSQLVVDHSLAVEHAGFDRDAFAKNRAIEERRNGDRFDFIQWAKLAFTNVDVVPQGNGILHQINIERMSPVVQVLDGVAFPDTLIGTDSHTPMINALGVLGIGVGGLEAESVMLGRAVWMRLPDIIGVELCGKPAAGINATDVVLALTQYLRGAKVVGSYVEFYGAGVAHLTLGDRATISNMTPEFGATAALFAIDTRTVDYLRLTGREESQIALVEAYAKAAGLWADTLADVRYERTIQFDLSTVVRAIAGPANPHQNIPTSTLSQRGLAGAAAAIGAPGNNLFALANEPTGHLSIGSFAKANNTAHTMPDGAVIIAAITSCTNTSNPRNMIAAGLIARNAARRGLTRKPWVKTSLAPGSKVVELYLRDAGLLSELETLGFGVVAFACTSCNGMSGALEPAIEAEVVARTLYTTAVLSGNRNFEGRIHPHAREAYLASPPLVVAYAIAGSIRVDIERDALGVDSHGVAVMLKDIWPDDAEIDALVREFVKPTHFNAVYNPMFARNAARAKVSPLYAWRAQSTYIRRPPYWDGAVLGTRSLKNLRPLAVLGDNITTDHLSPSNAILPDSAAGEYLAHMGLPQEDFNSYATHRGDHLTAQRATFANPRLKNEMVRDAHGKVREGSLTTLQPEGTVLRMWEAIQTYQTRRQPLIIVGGADYGQGSSRDWAAKGVRLAGVEAILAESFERIHRTNLVGMGILPLEFLPGTTRLTLQLDGTEVYEVTGTPGPRAELRVRVQRLNGEHVELAVICRLDTAEEALIYDAGGVLQRFAQDFLASSAGVSAA
jgi:2-methylcitrate dehydratase (2-methyl-trans-aconitate forming)